jgi:hypothetical protein
VEDLDKLELALNIHSNKPVWALKRRETVFRMTVYNIVELVDGGVEQGNTHHISPG